MYENDDSFALAVDCIVSDFSSVGVCDEQNSRVLALFIEGVYLFILFSLYKYVLVRLQ
jgi:hypothetical protein